MEKIKNPTCVCCDSELVPVTDFDEVPYDDDEFEVYQYKCPHCGVIEFSYPVPEEERSSYPAFDENVEDTVADCSHGYNGTCPECGYHIVWGGDFMRSEVMGDVPLTEEGEKLRNDIIAEIKRLEEEKDPDYADKVNKLQSKLFDIEYDYIDPNEDSLAPNVYCPHCGASIDVIYPLTSDCKNYPFYQETEENTDEK